MAALTIAMQIADALIYSLLRVVWGSAKFTSAVGASAAGLSSGKMENFQFKLETNFVSVASVYICEIIIVVKFSYRPIHVSLAYPITSI